MKDALNGASASLGERAQTDEEMRLQNAYLEALHQTTLGIIGRLDITELLQAIVERATSLVDCFYGWVYLVTPGKEAIEVKVGTGYFHRYVGTRLRRGEGLAGAIWQTGQPLVIADYRTWPGRSPAFGDDPVGSGIGVPMKSGGEVVGVIGLTRASESPPFGPAELEIMSRFAQLASIALDNARLHTSLQAELAERVRAEAALQERLAVERLIGSISTDLVNRAPNQVDAGILQALARLGAYTRADRSYLCLFFVDGKRLDRTHEWCALGIVPQQPRQRWLLADDLPWLTHKIRNLEIVQIQSPADLPPEAERERGLWLGADVQSMIAVPIVSQGTTIGVVGLDAVRAATVWSDSDISLLKMAGEIFVNAVQHQEARELLELANETLELRVEARTRELALLNAIAAAVSSSLNLKQVMSAALDKTLDVMDMEVGIGYRLQSAGGQGGAGAADVPYLHAVAQRGLSDTFMTLAATLPLRDTIAGNWSPTPRPVVWSTQDCPNAGLQNAFRQENLQRIVAVPLLAKGALVGAMMLGADYERSVAQEETAMLAAIGQQIGVAVDNARLYEEVEASAILAERQRLARDLHDAVTQTLFSATLIADVLPRLWQRRPEQARLRLNELRDLTRGALAEMRSLLLELRPSALTEIDLPDLLRQLSEAMMGRARLPVSVATEGRYPLPPDVKVAFYRIAQEALNNVAKHAEAHQISLRLRCQPDAVELQISDDGRGFDPAVVSGEHLGLSIMFERAAAIGARLSVDSQSGRGTLVSAVWSSVEGKQQP